MYKHKAIKIKDITGSNAVVVEMPVNTAIESEVEVRYVEDDMVISIEGYSSKNKRIDTSEQPAEIVPWGVLYMNNLNANISLGEGIKVSIIDTGIGIDHSDLVENIKGGYNSISKKMSYSGQTENGHYYTLQAVTQKEGSGSVDTAGALYLEFDVYNWETGITKTITKDFQLNYRVN